MSTKSQSGVCARRVTLGLGLVASAFTGAAFANQCADISEALTTMGDDYYNVESTHTDADERGAEQASSLQQTDLYKRIRDARFTSGTGERTRCFGTEETTRAETSSIELSDISQDENLYGVSRGLVIEADEYTVDENLRQRESIYIPLHENTDIVLADDSGVLELNTRKRQVTDIGSYLRETAIHATATDTGITLKESIYVNGQLAEWSSWILNTED